MAAQILKFPTTRSDKNEQPTFVEWMEREVGPRWCVVKRRGRDRFTIAAEKCGLPQRIQLLRREYEALELRYTRETGIAR